MTRLNKEQAHQLLAQICKKDSTLGSHIKLLVLLKRHRKLNIFYSDGDLSAQTRQTVVGNVTMGAIITPLIDDPDDPYNEDNLG